MLSFFCGLVALHYCTEVIRLIACALSTISRLYDKKFLKSRRVHDEVQHTI